MDWSSLGNVFLDSAKAAIPAIVASKVAKATASDTKSAAPAPATTTTTTAGGGSSSLPGSTVVAAVVGVVVFIVALFALLKK